MALMATDTGGGGNFKPVPQGTHLAVCNMVVDLGKQRTSYLGQEKVSHQVFIRWELPQERMEWIKDDTAHEGPMVVNKTYTLSLAEKSNLRRDLQSWRGKPFTEEELKGFDISKLLGVPCMVTVTHQEKGDKTYTNVTAVTGLPKGMPKPERCEADPILYDPDNTGSFTHLPQWLQDKINKQVHDEQPTTSEDPNAWRNDPLDDDVPF